MPTFCPQTFTDKLFGGNIHKQKENVPPLALTRELEELRSQVRSLTSQLASAKRKGHKPTGVFIASRFLGLLSCKLS